MYESQDTATEMLSDVLQTFCMVFPEIIEIIIITILIVCYFGTTVKMSGMLLGVGSILAHTNVEFILVPPTKTFSQLCLNSIQEHIDNLNYHCVLVVWQLKLPGHRDLIFNQWVLLNRRCQEVNRYIYLT